MIRPAALVAAGLLAFATQAGEVRVAVASNFTATANVLSEAFREKTGHRVVLSPGSTGKLYAQIVHGAPYDVLLAADVERPRRLEESGLTVPGSRFTYAVGRLVLWSPDPGRVKGGARALSDPGAVRLAIANPEVAPYGIAARQTLEALGLWASYRDRAARGENVAQAFQFVASGAADLGLVADSTSSAADGSRWEVPRDLYGPIEQQAVLLQRARDRIAASSFLTFLRTEAAAEIIAAAGYDAPSRSRPR